MNLINGNYFLTGTIRVYCRVRPFLPGQSNGQSTVEYIGENGNIMIVNPLRQGKDARKVFSFNKVFGTNVTQGMLSFLKVAFIELIVYFVKVEGLFQSFVNCSRALVKKLISINFNHNLQD